MFSRNSFKWAIPMILATATPSIAQEGTAVAKTWTFSAGLGSTKAWNLVGITKEVFVTDRTSLFATAGLGEMILGAGVAYYGNREGNGVVVSAVAGTGLQFVVTYQWKFGRSDFLAVGGSYIRVFGFSDVDHPQIVPVLAYEHRF
jgi:hypothetical protein